MEHSPELLQDTKSLKICSGNRAKMLLKGHLGIKCHSQYIKVIKVMSSYTVMRLAHVMEDTVIRYKRKLRM